MFVYDDDDRRSSFRVQSSEFEPVVITINNRAVHALDIGAGGVSFRSTGCQAGDSLLASIDLPGRQSTVEVTLKVLYVKNEDVCHCRFEELEEEAADEIHLYVLARQKEDVRKEKEQLGKEIRSGQHDLSTFHPPAFRSAV